MKTKAAVLNSNLYIVLAVLTALLAFVFASSANARSPVLKNKKPQIAKKAKARSVMFTSLKQRQLLAQNSSDAAADARLEGKVMQDSVTIAAPGATSKISTKVEKAETANTGPQFGAQLVIGTNQSNTSEGKKSYSGSYTLSPNFKIPKENISVSAAFEYNREYSYQLDDGKDYDWGNAGIKLTKKIPVGGVIDNFTFGPRLGIGMGREARRQTYKGGLSAGLGVDKKIGILTINQVASYSYRHFEYDLRDDGTVNSPHALDESTSLDVEVTDWMTLQASFGLSFLRSFQGVVRTYSTTGVGAEFALGKNASLGIGASTLKKNTLEPSGRSNRVKLWDKTDAVASIELGLRI